MDLGVVDGVSPCPEGRQNKKKDTQASEDKRRCLIVDFIVSRLLEPLRYDMGQLVQSILHLVHTPI